MFNLCEIYDTFGRKYLKIAKNVLSFLNFLFYYATETNFHKMYLKITKLLNNFYKIYFSTTKM